MSHTLHRSGSVESLKNDFPMLALGARGFNREGCAARIFELAGIVVKYSTANAGIIGFPDKLTPENLKDAQPLFTDTTVFHAVFTDEKELAACMEGAPRGRPRDLRGGLRPFRQCSLLLSKGRT